MLKFLFWILLFANAGLAAYQLGYLDAVLPSGHEPTRLQRQIEPQRLRVVAEPKSEAQEAPAAPQPEPETAQAGAEEAVPACIEVAGFTQEEARRFSVQLGALAARAEERQIAGTMSHMVYLPPQPDRASAERKAAELRALGIQDYFIIQDSSELRWAISLGVFKTEEGARAHLAELNRRGVRSARIVQRALGPARFAVRFRDLDAEAQEAVRRTADEFERKPVRECAP